MKILGIETSCDETAAAVVEDGTAILSSVVASQVEIHHKYGGVVPELASRKHLEAIGPVVDEALASAGVTVEDLAAVAATRGPGLVGALLVGFSFAKAYSWSSGLPFVGVNHLEGHLYSVRLGNAAPPFPFVALLASGGHTGIYHVTDNTRCELMGQTLDDAAGEAFDKVSKLLGLGYPGGAVIGRTAERGDPEKISFPRSFLDKRRYDFSFSGIKTAVGRYVQTHPDTYREEVPDIAAGFEEAVTDVLVYKLVQAAEERECRHLAIVGGVAANRRLREKAARAGADSGLTLHVPPLDLCGDNAAMIAGVGYHLLGENSVCDLNADVFSRSRTG